MRRPVQVTVGGRGRFDGQVHGVLAVSALEVTLVVTLSEDDGPYRVVPVLELFAAVSPYKDSP
ncbi:hypothetical protein [Kitasatospora mediocidica]|uniref:hypothetical protein n=1 Tax=Kitasatospora mediocidica TaxID=58352 RepID=UPI0012FA93DD|nr:hypothetical protein [Kitasatospora mediocidica]